MVQEILKKLFERDLDKLVVEIETYQDESSLWKIHNGISNSTGNLSLHLIGNLNHFFGAQLGNTGYLRNRELEFTKKDVPKAELIASIKAVKKVVHDVLDNISEKELKAEYPQRVFDEPITTEYMIIHLTTHLSYHLGQINYHRRLLDVLPENLNDK